MNIDDYFYYVHGTSSEDYNEFFLTGIKDHDIFYRIETTMEKLDEGSLKNGELEKIMKNRRDKVGELCENVFIIKIPKCYFPDHV